MELFEGYGRAVEDRITEHGDPLAEHQQPRGCIGNRLVNNYMVMSHNQIVLWREGFQQGRSIFEHHDSVGGFIEVGQFVAIAAVAAPSMCEGHSPSRVDGGIKPLTESVAEHF